MKHSLSVLGWALLGLLATPAAAQPTSPPALYVNDDATTGDVFTTATGSDGTGDGSTAAPFATVARALARADSSTQTIFIDTGTYQERMVLNRAVSLQGAGTATTHPNNATVFAGGLLPNSIQTSEAGLLIAANGTSRNNPLKVAGLTFNGYDYGIQADGSAPQANVLIEDVEVVHNRRQGIFWRSLGGVQNLTFRRVRAAYTAEDGNTTAAGAGRGLFLVNGHKSSILIEDGQFEFNRRNGIDVNDGSVSGLTVRNCQFTQNKGGALVVLGAAGARDGSGNFTGPAALIEGNFIRNNGSNGLELKSCTGSGNRAGAGSFAVRNNYIVRSIGAATNLGEDNAGLAFVDRDRGVITFGGGLTGDLITGGAFVENNIIRGYLADSTSSSYNINGFGLVLEGAGNKVFGNVLAQCQRAIQVQDRPANSSGNTAFFDISRNGYVVSGGDSIRNNRLDSCTTAIRTVNLTNSVDASLNWFGASTAGAVRGPAGTGGRVTTLAGPSAGFAEQSALAPAGQIDYSPFLNSGLDADPAPGFQPRLDYLNIDHYSPQSAAAGPLTEGVALTAENGTLNLEAASYNENVNITKTLTLNNNGLTSLQSLALNGPAKILTLAAAFNLDGSLTLTSGLLRTTATAILTLTDSATATMGNAASYVDGPLRKLGPRAFVFPLGKNGFWARLSISAPASAATAFTAEYQATAYNPLIAAAPLTKVSQVEYWTLDHSGSADAVSVGLYWENAFRSGIDDFSSDLQVATFTGSQWETTGNGGLSGNLNAGSVVSGQPVGAFTTFTLGSLSSPGNPLTPQMASFRADQSRPGVVDLKWQMTAETNSAGYTVERSNSPANWQPLGFVASQGPTAQPVLYTYHDQAVAGLTQAFYRLRQLDARGATRYSAVAAVQLSSPLAALAAAADQYTFYPNPATNQLTLRFPTLAAGPMHVLINDLTGRKVLDQTVGAGAEITIKLPRLAAGVYLLQIRAKGTSGQPQRLAIE